MSGSGPPGTGVWLFGVSTVSADTKAARPGVSPVFIASSTKASGAGGDGCGTAPWAATCAMAAGGGMLFLCSEQAGQTLPAPVKVVPQDVQTAISYLRRGEPQLYI